MKSMLNIDVISKTVDRMSQIKESMAELKCEYDLAEAEILKQFSEDIENTKLKKIRYSGVNSCVDATMADKVSLTYPSVLKTIFGTAYTDMVTEKVTCELKAPAKRMLAAIYNREVIKDMTLSDAIASLPCTEQAKKVLAKKIKGVKFETDCKNLIKIGELNQDDAESYAYFISEIVNWEQFLSLLKINNITSEEMINDIIKDIDSSVVAEKTPKISITQLGEQD